jgi:DNA polymerase V
MLAVVDCNNFYASCERVFNPRLEGKPVVVLSNNDGCIIARSNEAKAVGVKMGAPAFKFNYIFDTFHVQIFSANFSLYADMSKRVMNTLREFIPHLEVYSVDEAFLSFDEILLEKRVHYAKEIRTAIKKWIGIPVSIGIAETKTLAKAANEIAKQDARYEGVVQFTNSSQIDSYLRKLDVDDIWGIGWQTSKFLHNNGIYTALQLKYADDTWVKKHLTISGLKTVHELRGIPSITLEEVAPSKKSIMSSKSFGHPVESLIDIEEAIASYTARGAEKLREEKLVASGINVYLTTNWHKKTDKQYHNSYAYHVPYPTSYTPDLIHYAQEGLRKIFKPGYKYKKAMIVLTHLSPENEKQMNLFQKVTQDTRQEKLMHIVDSVNKVWGRETMRFAAQGLEQTWKLKCEKRSPRYTTNWNDILKVRT